MLSFKPGASLALIITSILFHTLFSYSIFDIWFVSPVVRVNESFTGSGSTAKRTVLIVGDGLRADKLFQEYPNPPFPYSDPLPNSIPSRPHALVSPTSSNTTPAPYMRGLIQAGNAKWGISHSRVPTESRPGHIALLCGIYEDVSAVFTGWKSNPVSVDSIANQSSHTFAFGSPDIVQMFIDGATPGQVDGWQYPHEFEDFSVDASHLDLYVLDHLRDLFKNASTDPALDSQLRNDQTFFFLHLLGLDSTGHSYRVGAEYHRAIRVVDYVVEQVVKEFEQFYGDELTSFVFTADHGMSEIGNHGDGHPDNTRTPLIVWGAGIGRDEETTADRMEETMLDLEEYSKDWNLNGVRKDIEQASVAPLISILGGFSIPVNSIGHLPLDYLDFSSADKAKSLYATAQQTIALFSTKAELKKSRSINYIPFPGFAQISASERVANIDTLIREKRFEESISQSLELVELGLLGIDYFQKYDWLLLQILTISGYLGFMLFSIDFLLRAHVFTDLVPSTPSVASLVVQGIGFATFSALSLKFVLEESPATYFLYAAFPYAFWTSILKDPTAIIRLIITSRSLGSMIRAIGTVFTLQLIVFGYTNRVVFTFMLASMALWPWLTMEKTFRAKNSRILSFWSLSSLAVAVFPSLPVEIEENIYIILSGGAMFLVLGYLALQYLRDPASVTPATKSTASRARNLVYFQMLAIVASMIVTYRSVKRLELKQGLPISFQISGWIILVVSSASSFFNHRVKQPPFERLAPLLLSFGPAFVILSLSYEGLFFSLFSTLLVLWLIIETKISEEARLTSKQKGKGDSKVLPIVTLKAEHLRISIFFLVFLHVGFFGVGNVASISSFYLKPVFRLIPVFMPFPMATLLLFKLLIPFLALSSIFSLLSSRLKLPNVGLFLIVISISDILTINFFLRVKDHGSWLEIGSSISHFAICSFLSVFNSLLFLVGDFLMSNL